MLYSVVWNIVNTDHHEDIGHIFLNVILYILPVILYIKQRLIVMKN